MKTLAPDFFDRRFDELVEAGRSRLPSLAPRWTDYNAHDPGITLMELLAFTTEAQLYGLARMRRGERAGYAALLGLRPEGPLPARGCLWPDLTDRDSPALSFQQSVVLETDAPVRTTQGDTPDFHLTHRILWTPGRVLSLKTRLADGTVIDQTRSNEHGDRAFEPFGSNAGPADRLRLEFESNGEQGIFPARRELADGAAWPLGVRIGPPASPGGPTTTASASHRSTPLSIELLVGTERHALPVIADGTRGFFDSGVLLLDVSGVPGSPRRFTLEISAPRGFARAPRLLRIEPGVLPIVQGGMVMREVHDADGMPQQRIALRTPGLRFGAGVTPVKVEVVENSMRREWRRVDDLSAAGPNDLAFELDAARETIVLGNGVNGHLPDFDSQILVSYPYCDGVAGNTPRNQRWSVRGIAGTFGINRDVVGGGRDALRDADLRREARRALRESHALVTAEDMIGAALGLRDLEVARALVPALTPRADTPREVVLIALRARTGLDEPEEPPETPRWLAAVRRALHARLPLGTRLRVRAPRYRSFSVRVGVEVVPRREPDDVIRAVTQALREEFVLVARQRLEPRQLGVPVSRRDLAALIRGVAGVRRIAELALLVGGRAVDEMTLKPVELPRFDVAASRIGATRGNGGRA